MEPSSLAQDFPLHPFSREITMQECRTGAQGPDDLILKLIFATSWPHSLEDLIENALNIIPPLQYSENNSI